MAPSRGGTDLLLFRVAEALSAQDYKTCGTVQINTERAVGKCDMDVQVLPNGPVLPISQNLGRASKGCRLDSAALEAAVGIVSSQITSDVDILIINKFGKHEAEGRGFRSVIASAIELGMPVLVGVNTLNLEAFLEFVGTEVTYLQPTVGSVLCWSERAINAKSFAA
ncbi:DUF2478 domain-containing protein [Lentibacter sp. XHP0401]|uniref:DUF2478 domain-containing protein n=1 Tax=Lentibacter sp. XHP0401 TaxID=2984334 RepID=UPI0021E7ACB9|nr:DUF2478 domain-containing protein [Lentibacter sp. XHP0401]MCV2893675.1 DUF2478 domain-containing protein [Lentibacter sp. XHP0401]